MSEGARFIIGVAGGSGSGKTTFARLLAAALNGYERPRGLSPEAWDGPVAGILSQDNYYIDQSRKFVRDGGDEVNFDHPDSLELSLLARHLGELRAGRAVEVPLYDFPTHTRKKETIRFEPRPVVIVDGILIFTQPAIVEQLDDAIFLDIEEKTRFERRFRRDTVERGRSPEGVREQFYRQVKPMHDLFVQPSASAARRIITDSASFERCLETVRSGLAARLAPAP